MTFDGRYYRLRDARMEPKAVGPMPLMIGGAGERVMPGIVARQADEWNVWGTPELFARKNALITRACEEIGRDPATLRRSTQALVVPGRDPEPQDGPRAIGGSVERLRDTFGRYAAAGVDEFIVADGHLRDPAASRELFDLLAEDVLPLVGWGGLARVVDNVRFRVLRRLVKAVRRVVVRHAVIAEKVWQ